MGLHNNTIDTYLRNRAFGALPRMVMVDVWQQDREGGRKNPIRIPEVVPPKCEMEA
jgi:hypothetical protein